MRDAIVFACGFAACSLFWSAIHAARARRMSRAVRAMALRTERELANSREYHSAMRRMASGAAAEPRGGRS